MIERHCCENCWASEIEEDVQIYMGSPYTGYTLEYAITWASERGYDTIITVVW